MGRKNNRIVKTQDKNFDKFIKYFMSEQKDNKINKEQLHANQKKIPVDYKKDNRYKKLDTPIDYSKRNKERLDYAVNQLEMNNIEYHIINEDKTFIECKRISDNSWLKYYASSGCILGYPDFRGIKSLIMLLKQKI